MKEIPYTVVHSNDPYLISRVATEMQMEGYSLMNTITDFDGGKYISIGGNDFAIIGHRGGFLSKPLRYELTSRNYTEVLTKILGE